MKTATMAAAFERVGYQPITPGTLTLKGIKSYAPVQESNATPTPGKAASATKKQAAAPKEKSLAQWRDGAIKELCSPRATRELVKFAKGTEFVLIFNCPRKCIPDGIQVIPAGGGSGPAGEAVEGVRRFRKAKIDLDGLMTRCLVDKINVRQKNEHCKVYVNCTVTAEGDRGFHFWHNSYEQFVRKEMRNAWERAVLKQTDGRTTLELRGTCEPVAVKIGFAVEG